MQEDYKQKVIDFFNSRTAYDSEENSHPQEAQRLLEYVKVKPEQTILDLATGTGLVGISAAKAVAPTGSVTGVDISPGMLAQAQEKMKAEAIENLELIEADVELIDFHSEQFDLIFCCSALVYLRDIKAMLDKCYRWLKSAGSIAFTTPDKSSYLADLRIKVCQNLFDIDLPHIIKSLWTPDACYTLLSQSGFQNIEIEKHQYRTYRIDKNYASTRIEQEFYPRGNPLLNLSEAEKELLQAEYQKAVEHLIVEQGVWQSACHLYVKATK